MDHNDHVNLIRRGVEGSGPRWADLGAGTGAFTLALADVLGEAAEIYAVDRDERALRANRSSVLGRFAAAALHTLTADFTESLNLPPLDGVVMANSLHFQGGQLEVVRRARALLREGGRLVLVEYNIGRGNFAVPHPVPFVRWQALARDAGFARTELLARRPSRFLKEIYSAMSQ